MRIAICEDDPLHAQLLAKMIAHWQKTNGVRIPISRSRQHEVNECMIAYYTNVKMTLEKQ